MFWFLTSLFPLCLQSIVSSVEDDKSQLSMRPQTPQADAGEGTEVDDQMWNKAAPLPTPEEKMRQTAKAVPTDIVPINITGMTPLVTPILQPFCPPC